MSTNATQRQETVEQATTETTNALAAAATEKTRKRARWEHFRFAACSGANYVNVTNYSYGVQAARAGEHTYSVRLQNGTPVECGCPADKWQPPCKHRVALADAPDVITEAAGTEASAGTNAGV